MPVGQFKEQCKDYVIVGARQEMFKDRYRTLLISLSVSLGVNT
jgi:hypothetical protein